MPDSRNFGDGLIAVPHYPPARRVVGAALEPNLDDVPYDFQHANTCGLVQGVCAAGCECACHRGVNVHALAERQRVSEKRPCQVGHPAGCACERCTSLRVRSVLGRSGGLA